MKKIIALFTLIAMIASCSKKEKVTPFLISKDQVGLLNKEVKVKELDSIYANDSIVKNGRNQFRGGNQISVYDKKGNQLLLLTPVQKFDSTSTVASIQIKDKRFKTEKGLTLKSTFKDISTNYKISRIENTLSNIVIFIDELNAYIAIDKKYISGDAKYNTDIPVEPNQIPDDAKIKRFWIGWE
ncbi:hypothetical protein [Mesonia aestuariivivens]|uniref:DUF4292 domain-containing protein n=1 Tax=Mesonia aestuariivivens TaxID=2796128 RepID=A0ABS6W2S8_9FLAO|nr:hypothetical protein [Mesonia aestuariivivens]MBW2962163.1 hypothetical protein [Mesonia aestuariivivens]